MNEKPIVLSICIPVYNGGEHLYENVCKILSSSNQCIEVVVSDNCSDDGCVDKLFEIEDSRLRIFRNEENIGPFRNWYMALQRGMGKYVMLLLDNNEIIMKNLDKFVLRLEKISAVVIRHAYGAEARSGIISVKDFMYYSTVYTHSSYIAYRKDAFDTLENIQKSLDFSYIDYPWNLWDIQILSKFHLYQKVCYINTDLRLIDASPKVYQRSKAIRSRTRSYDNKNGIPYSDERTMNRVKSKIDYLNDMVENRRKFKAMALGIYEGDIERATIGYYHNMHNRFMRERYSIPIKKYTPKEWLAINAKFYLEERKYLKKYCSLTLKENILLIGITIINKYKFEKTCFSKDYQTNIFYWMIWGLVKMLNKEPK